MGMATVFQKNIKFWIKISYFEFLIMAPPQNQVIIAPGAIIRTNAVCPNFEK